MPYEPWPAGCAGAVSLTFDDGMASHLAVAAPLLDRYELRATFYIQPSGDCESWQKRLEPWRAVARAGHEIGNHSLSHPCSQNHSDGGNGVERMSVAEIEADLDVAEERLRIGVPEYTDERTFCYPCYQSHVGAGPTRQSYVPAVARRFPAARGKGDKPNSARGVDLHYLWSWGVERRSGAELIGLCEWAALEGRWAVLTFHGINEGHLPVAEADLRLLCTHLARHRERIWTAPVVDVATRIADWRKELTNVE